MERWRLWKSRRRREAGAANIPQTHLETNGAWALPRDTPTTLPERVKAQASLSTSSTQASSLPTLAPAEAQPQQDGALPDASAAKKNYWHLAVEQLQEEDQSINEQITGVYQAATDKTFTDTDYLDLPTLLIQTVERSREALEAKRWRIQIDSGEFELREQFDRLIKAVMLFQDVGYAAGNIDPLHVGLPLAGFCVLMQIAVSDSKQYVDMVVGVEEILTMMTRYQEIERLYRSRPETALKQDFERRLISLYKHIVRYQISATCYYQRNTMLRFLRAIPKLDDVSELMTTIRRNDNSCKDIGQVFDSSDALERHQELLKKLNGLKTYLTDNKDPNSLTLADHKHWGVTRHANALFTGREDVLEELEGIVRECVNSSDRQGQTRIVISGVGGQGKSEVCLQLVHRVWPVLWGAFWVDVSTQSLAEKEFLDIASRLRIPAQTWEDARQGLANLRHPWLLVLDNADDPDVDYQSYFPTGPSGVVMLTSRNYQCERYATTKYIALDGLSEVAAQELLFKAAHISNDERETSRADAQVVANLLRSHPLALLQAGAYMSRGHCTLAQYPKVYTTERSRLLRFRPNQVRSRYGDIYTAFEASAAALYSTCSEASEYALQLLPVLAACGPSRLPLPLFEAAWKAAQNVSSDTSAGNSLWTTNNDDDDDLERLTEWHVSHLPQLVQKGFGIWNSSRLVETIYLLKIYSLVSTDTYDGHVSVSMHALIHAWARDRQNTSGQHAGWVGAGCLFALSSHERDIWQKHTRQLRSHLHAVTSWEMNTIFGSEPPQMIIRVLIRCGYLINDIRDDATLFVLMQQLFAYLGLKQFKVDARLIALYHLSAINLINLGKAQSAIALLEEVLRIRTQTLGEDHPDRLASQHELAKAYQANRQVKEAIVLLEEVFRIRTQTLREDHPDRLASQHELAKAYQAIGQVNEAIALLEQVLWIYAHTLGEDHPDRLASQRELAKAYQANGQVNEAIALLEQVLRIYAHTLGEDHPDRLASQHELAKAYRTNGQNEMAVALLEEVVPISRCAFPEDHPSRLAAQRTLATANKANVQLTEVGLLPGQAAMPQQQMLGTTMMEHSDTSDLGLTEGSTAPTMTDLESIKDEEPGRSIYLPNDEWEDPYLSDDDLISVLSVEDAITAREPLRKGRNSKVLEAEFVLGRAFIEHEVLAGLCKDVLSRVPRDRFIDNFRRLLGYYYLDLAGESKSTTERECANLMKDPMARIHIASDIANAIKPDATIVDDLSHAQSAREIKGREEVEHWLSLANKDFISHENTPDMTSQVRELTNSISDSTLFPSTPTPNIEAAKRFLFDSIAFRKLLCNLQKFLISAQLAPLCRVLLTIRSEDISFVQTQQLSTLDRIQILLERLCDSEWDWWPFQPPQRYLPQGYVRIHWRCHCGTPLSKDVEQVQAAALRNLLKLRGLKPYDNDHLCWDMYKDVSCTSFHNSASQGFIVRGFLASITPFMGICGGNSRPTTALMAKFYSASTGIHKMLYTWKARILSPRGGTDSDPQTQQDCHFSNLSSGSGDLSSPPSGLQSRINSQGQRVPGPAYNEGAGLNVEQSVSVYTVDVPDHERSWILFGVTGHFEYFEIDHLDARPSKIKSDDELFRALRISYTKLKRFFRRWFSVWHLSHCDIIKFAKPEANNIFRDIKGPDLPSQEYIDDYVFDSHGCPLTIHEFQTGFNPCSLSCRLSLFHQCIRRRMGTRALERIPKKKTLWPIEADCKPKEAWGLYAREVPSAWRVTLYQLLILLGPFGFWIWWLSSVDHRDWQTASVPAAIVISLQALFWTQLGLLRLISNLPQ